MAFAGLVAANNLSDVASVETTWDNIGDGITATVSPALGLTVQLFDDTGDINSTFTNLRSTNVEPVINFTKQYAIEKGGTGDNFSIRAVGQVQARQGGSNTFSILTDDGVRVSINGVQVLNEWYGQSSVWHTFTASGLTQGQWYNIQIEHFQGPGDARLVFANKEDVSDPVRTIRAGTGIVIKGADILALTGISRLSTRDILLLNGLTSNVQTRLNTSSQQISSGIVFQNNALPKASPTSSGNYSINSTLIAQSLRINNIPVQSLATAPFSGSTATTPILLNDAIITNTFTMQGTISSGVVSSPSIAIPVRDGNYVYYLKAGQS